eukprot:1215040-Pyramimonas_sp.AAC.1
MGDRWRPVQVQRGYFLAMDQSDAPGESARRRREWRRAPSRRGGRRRTRSPPRTCPPSEYILTTDQSDAGIAGIFSRLLGC